MTASSTTRYDVEALKNRAGGMVFARGEAYHRDGRARLLFSRAINSSNANGLTR